MSTMDKEMMKIFLRILQGAKGFNKNAKDKLLDYAKTILNNDKSRELEELIASLFPKVENENTSILSGNKNVTYPNSGILMVL